MGTQEVKLCYHLSTPGVQPLSAGEGSFPFPSSLSGQDSFLRASQAGLPPGALTESDRIPHTLLSSKKSFVTPKSSYSLSPVIPLPAVFLLSHWAIFPSRLQAFIFKFYVISYFLVLLRIESKRTHSPYPELHLQPLTD